jgi:hypothetical protein
MIDAIPSWDEQLVLDSINALGVKNADRLVLRGADCTMAKIRDAFASVRTQLLKKDRLIIYVNGHGMRDGSGAIRMVDGFLTSQSLSDLLADVSTPDCFVVIDSCFGGKFVRALRGENDAVVLASTDTKNVSYRRGLASFWNALGRSTSDRDRDGQVTVEEACWVAYSRMLARGERARQGNLKRAGNDPDRTELMAKQGYQTPQFAVLGDADPSVFAVPVSPRPTTQPASPR